MFSGKVVNNCSNAEMSLPTTMDGGGQTHPDPTCTAWLKEYGLARNSAGTGQLQLLTLPTSCRVEATCLAAACLPCACTVFASAPSTAATPA